MEIVRKIKGLDAESSVMVYQGLNLSQMTQIFECDRRDLTQKIEAAGIKPCGMNGGYAIYKLKDVMPVVVKPVYDVESYLRNMHPNELPKHLAKEFWAGQRSKQEFELKAGDLWPTQKVISEVGELFKLVKMSALLAMDTVERQVELTEEQRAIIKRLMDGMLIDMHKTIVDKFSKKEDMRVETEDDEL
jgi:hypothetical protein